MCLGAHVLLCVLVAERAALRAAAFAVPQVARTQSLAARAGLRGNTGRRSECRQLKVAGATGHSDARRDTRAATCVAQQTSAAQVVRGIYAAYNERDIEAVMAFMDERVEYQNGNFQEPFKGKNEVRQLFGRSCEALPADMAFVLDDVTERDPLAVGILWHLEVSYALPTCLSSTDCRPAEGAIAQVDGKVFPQSNGCSFYRIDAGKPDAACRS